MSHNNKQTNSSGIQGNYKTQLAKSHNNQIINIIMQNALKKKKRNKKNKPEPQEEPQPEPDTLENAAKRIPPNLYPPTNVITINPAGISQTPTMFDVQRQQQLNAYDNIKETLKHEMASMRMDLANYRQNGGEPVTVQQMEELLKQFEMAFSNQQPPESLSALTDPENYQEYDQQSMMSENYSPESMMGEAYSPEIISQPQPQPEQEPELEQEQEPERGMARKYPSTKLPKSPDTNISSEVSTSGVVQETTPRPSTPPPQIQRVKSMIEDSINKHGQKSVIKSNAQKNLSYLINADYRNMSKKEQNKHKASLREYADAYINDMINSKEKQNEARKQLEGVFNKGKHINTQMKFLKQLLDVE